eukprot:2331190-Prymnesium_polylepis.1
MLRHSLDCTQTDVGASRLYRMRRPHDPRAHTTQVRGQGHFTFQCCLAMRTAHPAGRRIQRAAKDHPVRSVGVRASVPFVVRYGCVASLVRSHAFHTSGCAS